MAAVGVEIDRQHDGIGRERRGLHHSHRRMDAERACLVGRRRDHAAARIVGERREAARHRMGDGIDALDGPVRLPTADDDRPAAQFRIAQQLDRRVERVHVEVGDHVARRSHSPIVCRLRKVIPAQGTANSARSSLLADGVNSDRGMGLSALSIAYPAVSFPLK